nr:MAG TPA: Ribosomal protein L17 [Crassvirales sp.]
MTTPRQKAAVHFCERLLKITFSGDINNRTQVSDFLSVNLEDAKNLFSEIAAEYKSYIWDLD